MWRCKEMSLISCMGPPPKTFLGKVFEPVSFCAILVVLVIIFTIAYPFSPGIRKVFRSI